MAANINTVTITGNLTRDPELRSTASGTSVANMRIAVNESTKDQATGEWTERANYFNVTVWGRQAEMCAQYLTKGRPVAIAGRLQWREWNDRDGNRRESVDIVADRVQFLGPKPDGARPASDIPVDSDYGLPGDPYAAPAGAAVDTTSDDLPF